MARRNSFGGPCFVKACALLIAGFLQLPASALMIGDFYFTRGLRDIANDTIVLATVVDTSSFVWQAYADYIQWLNEQGGITIGGVPTAIRLFVLDPDSEAGGPLEDAVYVATLPDVVVDLILGSGNPIWDELLATVAALRIPSRPFVSPLLLPTSAVRMGPNIFAAGTPTDRVLGDALRALKGQGAEFVHTISEDSTWAHEVCGAAGGFGVPLGSNVTVPGNATVVGDLLEALNTSKQMLDTSKQNVLAACISDREMCQQLLNAMVELDYNVAAVVATNCIEEDLQYSANWEKPLYSWVLGADTWSPNLAASTAATSIWDPEVYLNQYVKAHETSLVRKEYAAALNAVWLVLRAVEASNSRNATDWATWLSTANETTDHGTFFFDAHGQRQVGALTKQFVRPTQFVALVGGSEPSALNLTYPKPWWSMVDCIGDIPEQRGLLWSNDFACQQCPDTMTVRYDDVSELRYCEFCARGSFAYKNGDVVDCVKCSPGSFNNDDVATECDRCAPGKFQAEWEQTSCIECPTGKVALTAGQSACGDCPDGTYSSGADTSSCEGCPSGALCEGGTITNRKTYYLVDDGGEVTASNFYKCIHGDWLGLRGEACLANSSCWRDEEDRVTMEGILCGKCKEGFGKEGSTGLCKKCGSTLEVLLSASLEPLLYLMLVNGFLLLVLNTDYQKPKNTWSIIGKQVMSYMQMLSALSPYLTLENNLGPLQQVLSLQKWVGIKVPAIALSGANCLAALVFEGWKPFNITVLTGYFYMPVLLMMIYSVFLAAKCWGRIDPDMPILSHPTFITVVVVYVFFLHQKSVELFIAVLDCRNIENRQLLLLDLEVECFSEEHVPAAAAAIIGLFVYGLGIPLLFFWILFTYNRKLSLDDPALVNTMGFFYAGFERRVFWFESVLMLRRITFPIVVALSQSTQTGIALGPESSLEEQQEVFNLVVMTVLVVVLLFFYGLHLLFQPYDNRCYFLLDRIETLSLWAIMNTCTAQVFLTVVKVRPWLEITVFFLLLSAHCMFWALVFWGIFRRALLECLASYLIPAMGSKWLSAKASWLVGGSVKVLHDGFDVRRLIGLEQESFSFLMEEILEKHIQSFPSISFRGLVGTMQCMCIEAAHMRRLAMLGLDEEPDGRAVGTVPGQLMNGVAKNVRRVVDRTLSGGAALTPAEAQILEAEYSKEAWDIVVSQQYRFTVEELHMGWLRLASRSWRDQEDMSDLEEYNSPHARLIRIFREGFPHKAKSLSSSGSETEESIRSSYSGSSEGGTTTAAYRRSGTGATPRSTRSEYKKTTNSSAGTRQGGSFLWSLTHGQATGSAEEIKSPVTPANAMTPAMTPMTPMTPGQTPGWSARRDEAAARRRASRRLGQGRARSERLMLLRQVAELQERSRRLEQLELAMEALAGQKDTLTILVLSARHLAVDQVYYVTASITGKEFGAKMQTHAVHHKASFSNGPETHWNYAFLMHGYGEGDSIRFTVWAWGKKKTGEDVKGKDIKIGTADLGAEEVAASLEEAAGDGLSLALQLEASAAAASAAAEDAAGPRPSLQVQILSHGTLEGPGGTVRDALEQHLRNSGDGPGDGEGAPPRQPRLSSKEGPPLPPRDSKGPSLVEGAGDSGSGSEEEPVQRFRVVPENGLKVRSAPDMAAAWLDSRWCGDVVAGRRIPAQSGDVVSGEWIKLEHIEGYMLRRRGDRDFLVQESGAARGRLSGMEMAVMAAPFRQRPDHIGDALRRPELEAGSVEEKPRAVAWTGSSEGAASEAGSAVPRADAPAAEPGLPRDD